jgi:AcrR family transcriptional regulator
MTFDRFMSHKKEDIIAIATKLFARDGYHAVGVDRIIAESGVAKMTFYKHFPSKNKLIVAVLEARSVIALSSLRTFVGGKNTPMKRLQAVFDWHAKWFGSDDFTGCMFIAATAEFHNSEPEVSRCSSEHKRLLTGFISEILSDLVEHRSVDRLARQTVMLLDGAVTAALVHDRSAAAKEAWVAMQALVTSATGPR